MSHSDEPLIPALAVALDVEISPFGLRSVCFELSNFVSNALSPGSRVEAKSRLSAYDDATNSAYEWLECTSVGIYSTERWFIESLY